MYIVQNFERRTTTAATRPATPSSKRIKEITQSVLNECTKLTKELMRGTETKTTFLSHRNSNDNKRSASPLLRPPRPSKSFLTPAENLFQDVENGMDIPDNLTEISAEETIQKPNEEPLLSHRNRLMRIEDSTLIKLTHGRRISPYPNAPRRPY